MRVKRFLCIGIILSISLLVLTSCYQARYSLEKCNTESQGVEFTSKYVSETFTAYFDSSVKTKSVDEWIDRFAEYSVLLSEKDIDNSLSYYVSDKIVVNYNSFQNGVAISLPANIAKDEAFAWVLAERLGNKLPYGVYAGISAYWLNGKYKLLSKSEIINAGYLAEMQFPIYETNNLSSTERATAWNISYTIVNDWIKSGKQVDEITELTTNEFDSYLQSTYNISLPNYEFSPYSTEYEYMIVQDCLTYYINKEYTDLILPKKYFTTKYDKLSDWLKDNWKMKLLSDQVFNVSSMPHIDIYMNDGLDATSHGYGGYSSKSGSKRKIDLWAAGVFYHEYNHHVHDFKGLFDGNLTEELPELNCNDSKYGRLSNYYLCSNNSHFPYPEEYYYNGELINEKKMNSDAMKLYKKVAPSSAVEENFDYWLFADCYSALRKDSLNYGRYHSHSLFHYILNAYGYDCILLLNENANADIDGKTLNQVKEEWRNEYLPQFLR